MECPHLASFDATKLTASPTLQTILTSTQNGKIHPQASKISKSAKSVPVQYQCQVCKSHRSPWLCLFCGKIHCGRYVNSHAKEHFQKDNQHFLAICCHSRSAFCYACDDYVINEAQSKKIQKALEQFFPLAQESSSKSLTNNKRKDLNRDLSSDGLSEEAKTSLKAKKIKLSGLRNLGNTCYMNSVLQCLSNIHRFTSSVGDPPGGKVIDTGGNGATGTGPHRRRLMQATSMNDNAKSELLFETLRDTMYLIRKGVKSTVIPESLFTMLCKVPRFRGYQQQDAHEFLRYVLDRLHQECLENCAVSEKKQAITNNNISTLKNPVAAKKATMIGNIFGGILQNEVNCLECGFKSHKQDPFLDLSLDIPLQRTYSGSNFDTASSNNSDNSNSSCSTSEECNLIDCLSSFIELEELTETELYYCSNCQQKQRSTKRFWIRRLPDVLCLHLKRFRYNNYLRTKIDNYIKFPIQGLDMKRFVTVNKHETRGSSCGPTTYDLVAFIEHHGSGLGSGHYTAFCRHDKYWFHYDDSSVTACDESKVRQSKAYILFYNRRTS